MMHKPTATLRSKRRSRSEQTQREERAFSPDKTHRMDRFVNPDRNDIAGFLSKAANLREFQPLKGKRILSKQRTEDFCSTSSINVLDSIDLKIYKEETLVKKDQSDDAKWSKFLSEAKNEIGLIEVARLIFGQASTKERAQIAGMVSNAASQEVAKNAPTQSTAPTPSTLTPAQIEAVFANSTLGKLLKRYEDNLQSINLPASGFTTSEQAQAAARLSTTYQNLRKEQLKLGFRPLTKDARVVEAERLKGNFYEKSRKENRPSRGKISRQKKRPSPR